MKWNQACVLGINIGDDIEIFETTNERWERYQMTGWEKPRKKNNKWLFTAKSLDSYCQNEARMIVEPERIRRPSQQEFIEFANGRIKK